MLRAVGLDPVEYVRGLEVRSVIAVVVHFEEEHLEEVHLEEVVVLNVVELDLEPESVELEVVHLKVDRGVFVVEFERVDVAQ